MMWNLVAGNSNFTVNADIEIFEKYRPAGILQGEELLLRHSDALQFIADCEGLGLTILGMNFFEQQGNKIIELLCPADYSSLSLEVNITVAETAMGKPLSKASNGGLSDVLRESLDFTRGEFQVGLEPCVPNLLKVRLEPFPNGSPMSVQFFAPIKRHLVKRKNYPVERHPLKGNVKVNFG